MVKRRHQLVKAQTREKLQLRAVLRNYRYTPENSPWSKAWIAELRQLSQQEPSEPSDLAKSCEKVSPSGPISPSNKPVDFPENVAFILDDQLDSIEHRQTQIAKILNKMKQMVDDDPLVAMLLQFKGIGIVTAIVMRAEIGDFSRLNNGKQLANFCGVSPRNASSGKRQATSGLINAGSPMLRGVLIEAAQRLARYDEHWSGILHRLHVQKHKPKCVAIAAVANRWVRKLYHRIMELFYTPLPTNGTTEVDSSESVEKQLTQSC